MEATPKLRFKGFDNKYEVKKIDDLANINPKTSVPDNFNYIDLGSVKNGVLLSYKSLNVKEAPSRAQRLLEKNDIIFQAVRPYQQNNYLFNLDGKYVASTGYLQIRGAKVASFLYQYFLTNKFLIQVLRFSEGSSYPAISSNAFKKISLNIPSSLKEQQKIASFLTSIDDKITLLTKKKELLEHYKKGVMQKIFSQEIRFKDDNGNDFPDWEDKILEEIANYRRGSFPQPYGLSKWYDDVNGFPFIQVYDVGGNMMLKPTTKRKISDEAKELSVFVNKETIILTIQGSIGRVAITQYDACVDRTLLIFESFKIPIDKKYFIYLIYLLFEVEKRKAPGGTIKTITKQALGNFKVKVPSETEQQKIGSFLFSLDKKIGLVDSQIDKTKEFKKGLLQQMFV